MTKSFTFSDINITIYENDYVEKNAKKCSKVRILRFSIKFQISNTWNEMKINEVQQKFDCRYIIAIVSKLFFVFSYVSIDIDKKLTIMHQKNVAIFLKMLIISNLSCVSVSTILSFYNQFCCYLVVFLH